MHEIASRIRPPLRRIGIIGLSCAFAFRTTFRREALSYWCELLEGSDSCVAPVLSIGEAPQHRHLEARGTFINIDGIVQPAPAPRFSRSQPAQPIPPQPPQSADVSEAIAAWLA